MRSIAVRWCEALDAFASGTDRLVHPSVPEGPARARQARLITAILCGIAVFSLGLCVVLPGRALAASEAAALGAAGGLAIASLLWVVAWGWERAAGCLALAAGAVAATSVCVLAGGLASPLAAGLIAVPLEAWAVRRERGALLAGIAAGAAGIGCVLWTGGSAGGAAPVHPAAWLPVLAWGGALWTRTALAGRPAGRPAATLSYSEPGTAFLGFDPSGEIADASPPVHDLFGLAPELLLGTGFFERLHVADRVTFLCASGDMKHGAAKRRVELRVRLPRAQAAGETVFRSVSLDLFRTDDPAMPFGGSLRDIGELHDLREALNAAREAETRALAERAQLLATLGHELRTPLNAIMGFAGMLASDALGAVRDPRQKEYAALIGGCGEHLLAVMDTMLDVGRLQAGARRIEPEVFRVGDAAEACRAMMAMQAGAKGVSLCLDAGMFAGPVSADRRVVQQILLNLVSNAVKFTPPGGRVTVGAQAGAGELRVSVSDTGIGISRDDISRLGKPWTRLEGGNGKAQEGHGLGLALVNELAALHGGAVRMESARGKGTTVCVTLPDALSAASSAAQRETALTSSLTGETIHHGGFRKTA